MHDTKIAISLENENIRFKLGTVEVYVPEKDVKKKRAALTIFIKPDGYSSHELPCGIRFKGVDVFGVPTLLILDNWEGIYHAFVFRSNDNSDSVYELPYDGEESNSLLLYSNCTIITFDLDGAVLAEEIEKITAPPPVTSTDSIPPLVPLRKDDILIVSVFNDDCHSDCIEVKFGDTDETIINMINYDSGPARKFDKLSHKKKLKICSTVNNTIDFFERNAKVQTLYFCYIITKDFSRPYFEDITCSSAKIYKSFDPETIIKKIYETNNWSDDEGEGEDESEEAESEEDESNDDESA